MKILLPYKHLVVIACFAAVSTHLVIPSRAEWMMNRYGDLVYQDTVVLGEATNTSAPELDELFNSDASLQREIESLSKEISQTVSTTPSTKVGSKSEYLEKRIPRSGVTQVRVAPPGAPKREPKEDDIFDDLDMTSGSDESLLDIDIMPKEGEDARLRQNKFTIQKGDKNIELSPVTNDPKKLEMRRDQFKAKLPYTVKIDPVSQEIRVESPAGDLPIRVMPEEAREKLDERVRLKLDDIAPDTPQVIDGKLAYAYEGTVSKKLFGFFPVKLNKKVIVSAEDGAVTEEKQTSLFGRFLDYWAE